jgi:hypothetical protein
MFFVADGEAQLAVDAGFDRSQGCTGRHYGEGETGHNGKSKTFSDHIDQRSEILYLEADAGVRPRHALQPDRSGFGLIRFCKHLYVLEVPVTRDS